MITTLEWIVWLLNIFLGGNRVSAITSGLLSFLSLLSPISFPFAFYWLLLFPTNFTIYWLIDIIF